MAKYLKLIICMLAVVAMCACEKKEDPEVGVYRKTYVKMVNNTDVEVTGLLTYDRSLRTSDGVSVEANSEKLCLLDTYSRNYANEAERGAQLVLEYWDSVKVTHVSFYNGEVIFRSGCQPTCTISKYPSGDFNVTWTNEYNW